MGLMFGLILSAMVGYGFYCFVRKSKTRRAFWSEFKEAPLYSAYVCIWVAFCLLFLWGILIPILGTTRINLGGLQIQLWELGGVGALVGLAGHFFIREPLS